MINQEVVDHYYYLKKKMLRIRQKLSENQFGWEAKQVIWI